MARYHPFKISLLSLAVACVLFAIASCTGQGVPHSFEFGNAGDNKGIEILNYRYEDDRKVHSISPPDWALKTAHIGQTEHIYGTFPPGDSLYVKWRVISTGKVYENAVDLRNRLPSNMDHQRITFIIKDSQLYVYVVSEEGTKLGAPDCPVIIYYHNKCTQIYPSHWQNF